MRKEKKKRWFLSKKKANIVRGRKMREEKKKRGLQKEKMREKWKRQKGGKRKKIVV